VNKKDEYVMACAGLRSIAFNCFLFTSPPMSCRRRKSLYTGPHHKHAELAMMFKHDNECTHVK
jgi:hypothetical protein